MKVKVVGRERAEAWGFWTLWTTGLWRGRRAVLRSTSEMVGRRAQETQFYSLEADFEDEGLEATGYERAEHPADMPADAATEAAEEHVSEAEVEDQEVLEMEERRLRVVACFCRTARW